MNPAQASDGKRPWGCLIASGLMSLLGLSVLCGALILLFSPPGLRRPAATSPPAIAGPGIIGASGNAVPEATNAPSRPAATASLTATNTVTLAPPTPTASPTSEPPPPTPDTEGPPAPAILGPMDHQRISCQIPVSVALRWETPGDPSGIESYQVRLAKFGPDFTEEQLFDPLPAGQTDLAVTAECGRSYGWKVLARDGSGNQGVVSEWAYFDVDTATQAPAVLGPANYKHLSCVAQIILRWEAPDDPDGIFGYMVTLQEVLGAGYGEAQQFGWMVPSQYDATRPTDCGRDYRWRVFASDQLLNEGPWSEWAYFIVDPPGQ